MSRNPEDNNNNNTLSSTNKNLPPIVNLVDCSLRLCVIPLSLATIWLTITNQQDNTVYGKLDFGNLTGLKYMVFVSVVCAAYALVGAVYQWIRYIMTKAWFFFVTDQVMAYLMITSMAAVMEITYLAYNGDREVTWSEACSSYGKFCSKMKVALALHAIALACFIILAVISAYRVFSLFELPSSIKEVEEEERT
ncbi:hypothetical protein ACFE04_023750 [Oxalis oulophora]